LPLAQPFLSAAQTGFLSFVSVLGQSLLIGLPATLPLPSTTTAMGQMFDSSALRQKLGVGLTGRPPLR